MLTTDGNGGATFALPIRRAVAVNGVDAFVCVGHERKNGALGPLTRGAVH